MEIVLLLSYRCTSIYWNILYFFRVRLSNTSGSQESQFAYLMVFTSCAVAFAHGSNDVANAIGPLAAIHQATNQILGNAVSPDTPLWILFLGAAGIVIGLATLGYRGNENNW